MSTNQEIKEPTAFVLPIVSPSSEKVTQISENIITIKKSNSTVRVGANVALFIKEMPERRTFNMVPGVEAVPIIANFQKDNTEVKITIEII